MAKENEKKKTFEEALAELEKIVGDVEAGEIGLEESIDQYEAGMKLIKYCRAILDQAEKRIGRQTRNKPRKYARHRRFRLPRPAKPHYDKPR